MATDPSSSGEENSMFSEFLADYFTESDEHLSNARRSVLALEPQLQRGSIDRGLLDELFRNFHSLKGLSAMMGFYEAEQLAHQLEAFLSAVRKGQVHLEVAGLEVLISGIATLEQVIAARRDAIATPNISPLLDQVAELLPKQDGSDEPASQAVSAASRHEAESEKDRQILERLAAGQRAYRIRFEPSVELINAGIDVNYVRRRLQELGEIARSEPVVEGSGKIAFTFVLVSDKENVCEDLAGQIGCEVYELHPAVSGSNVEKPPADAEFSTHLTPANLVRVDLAKLDELMRLVGELVLSRARLEAGIRRIQSKVSGGDLRSLQETNAAIERQLRDLREGVMRVRMVPVREVFARMQFVVRDMVREFGKQAVLKFSGEETQIDKYVVERIMDPLLHLVRNAVSHGLESREERIAAGKEPEGRIDLRARTTGENVVIEVEDDGRGIDVEQIARRARTRGIQVPETLDSHAILDILCVPGFSVREQADRVSGRGVGMDVVHSVVVEMGGALSMETHAGRGTRFTIQLPLTLAIIDALIVKVGSERFAVPQGSVREVIHSESQRATQIENNELLRYHGGVLPLVRLGRLFQTSETISGSQYSLVVGEGVHAVGLVVDQVLGLREVVVRPLTDRLVKVPGIAGATELGDGKVVLILDVPGLLRGMRKYENVPSAIHGTGSTLPISLAAQQEETR